jgi:hypothetical protein
MQAAAKNNTMFHKHFAPTHNQPTEYLKKLFKRGKSIGGGTAQ